MSEIRKSEAAAIQERLYGHLTFINNLLLIPMFTVVVLEINHHSVAENLDEYSSLYLWFCGSFALE
ncbi:MAG: hypothetical protein ACI8X5_003253 [Planctomycetota bacterium]|jgi:hypothetical protein